MATGGVDRSVDSRVTCSVCLEPYRGRQPKILPCFHTFCSPCLNQIYDVESRQAKTREDRKETRSTPVQLSITCPTCRTLSFVPTGGVSGFQSNFYVEEIFGELCSLSQGQSLQTSLPPVGELDDTALLEVVLRQLSEEELQLETQRQELYDVIGTRYAVTLTHVADARDSCLKSLRDATQQAADALKADVILARDTHYSLLRHASGKTSKAGESRSLTALTENDRELFRERITKGRQAAFLRRSENDVTSASLQQVVQDFLGMVTPSSTSEQPKAHSLEVADIVLKEPTQPTKSSDPNTKSATKSVSLEDTNAEDVFPAAPSQPPEAWRPGAEQKLEDLADKVTQLSNKYSAVEDMNKSLRRDLKQAHDNNASLLSDLHNVKKDMDGLKHKQLQMYEDAASRDNHMMTLLSNSARVSQDVTSLQKDNTKLRQDLGVLRTAKAKLSQDVTDLQTESAKLKKDVGAFQTDKAKLSHDVTDLQTKSAKLKKDVGVLQDAFR